MGEQRAKYPKLLLTFSLIGFFTNIVKGANYYCPYDYNTITAPKPPSIIYEQCSGW